MLTEVEVQAIKPLRHSRKVSDSGGLHLLVTPRLLVLVVRLPSIMESIRRP